MAESCDFEGGTDCRGMFFVHIPKCGGTTFSAWLSQHYARKEILEALQTQPLIRRYRQLFGQYLRFPTSAAGRNIPPEGEQLLAMVASKRLIVENHIHVGAFLSLSGKFRGLTMVREPRARILSLYRHIRRAPLDKDPRLPSEFMERAKAARSSDFPEFIRRVVAGKNRLGYREFDNWQVRQLSTCPDVEDASDALDNAMENLGQIEFVGLTEELDTFASLVAACMGWPPPSAIQRLNVYAGPGTDAGGPDAGLLAAIPDELVIADEQLYRAATHRYRELVRRVAFVSAREKFLRQGESRQAIGADRYVIDMDEALAGDGWHAREGKVGESVRWIGPNTSARVYLPTIPGRIVEIQVWIVALMSQTIFDSTKYRFNGVELPPRFHIAENMTVATIEILASINDRRVGELEISSDATATALELFGVDDIRPKTIAVRKFVVRHH